MKTLFIPFFIFFFSFSEKNQLKMSQDSDKPHSGKDKLSGSEDGQEESLDNPDQSIRKRVRQNAPVSHGGDTLKCKQNGFITTKKSHFCNFSVGTVLVFYSILCKLSCFAIKYCVTPIICVETVCNAVLPILF